MKVSAWKKALVAGVLVLFGMMLMTGCGKTGEKDSTDISEDPKEPDASEPDNTPIVIDMENEVGVTVNFPERVTDENIEELKKNGITYVRLFFYYPFNSDGSTPSLSYITAKKSAKRFHDAGFKIMAQSFWPGGRGYDAQTNSVRWISNLPEVYEDFDDEYFYKIAQTATKYMAKDLAEICDTWLISNEIDISTYTGTMTVDQIVRYVKACTEGVREGNPNASCGVNMLVEVSEARSRQLVDALYGEEPVLDWLGLDGYYATLQAGGPERWEYYINTFYEAAKVPIVITEWSYSSAESDPLGTCKFQWEGHGNRGAEVQAEYVAACMDIFVQHPEVIGTFWYALHDQDEVCWECGNPECNLYSSWGLLHVDGSPKPSLEAMGEAAERFRAK